MYTILYCLWSENIILEDSTSISIFYMWPLVYLLMINSTFKLNDTIKVHFMEPQDLTLHLKDIKFWDFFSEKDLHDSALSSAGSPFTCHFMSLAAAAVRSVWKNFVALMQLLCYTMDPEQSFCLLRSSTELWFTVQSQDESHRGVLMYLIIYPSHFKTTCKSNWNGHTVHIMYHWIYSQKKQYSRMTM